MPFRLVLIALAALLAVPVFSAPAEASRRACQGYGYGGFQSPVAGYGVSGQLTATKAPQVVAGHVAAWIGVGGAGMGPNGADEWIQAGIAGFPDGHSELYYEYTTPGQKQAQYVTVAQVSPGETHEISVYERPTQPNAWRVSVDGARVSGTIVLPGSHGAWRPIATTETWDGGSGACNTFGYDFKSLAVATQLGGGWQPFGLTRLLQDAGHTVQARASGFSATLA